MAATVRKTHTTNRRVLGFAVKVVGTAGHIDHGKSSLVHRLTGIDPDRLEEEKRRGMTIDLGFAWLQLSESETVSIVDVPGHERFVANMLAGVGGIDAALLVVAADESVMPQTREHVDILDLLGISSGVVALTKVDLADADLIAIATSDVQDLLSRTSLAGSPIIPVSSVTGDGLPDLVGALREAVASVPPRVNWRTAYLPIDRVFTVSGFGTVVTGTLHDGVISTGDEVELLPSGAPARIRSLQTHSRTVNSAGPGARVAANLSGIDRQDVVRGDVLALRGRVRATQRFDARLRVVDDAPFALKHGQEAALHLGAGEYPVTVSVLGRDAIGPGETGWVQVRSRFPVPALRHQRFILRLPAPARTVAGGEVMDVRPRHRRNDESAVRRLDAFLSGDDEQVLEAVLMSPRALTLSEIADSTDLSLFRIEESVRRALHDGTAVRVGERYIGPQGWARMCERATAALQQFHDDNPLRRGMAREELRSRLHQRREEWNDWLAALLDHGVVVDASADIALPGFRNAGRVRSAERDRVIAVLSASEFSPPSGRDLLEAARTEPGMLVFLADEGRIVHVGGGVYFAAEAYERLVAIALGLIDEAGGVSMAQFRDAVGTSRKYAQAFLEHLDSRRVTRRVGDVRVRGREAPACA